MVVVSIIIGVSPLDVIIVIVPDIVPEIGWIYTDIVSITLEENNYLGMEAFDIFIHWPLLVIRLGRIAAI